MLREHHNCGGDNIDLLDPSGLIPRLKELKGFESNDETKAHEWADGVIKRSKELFDKLNNKTKQSFGVCMAKVRQALYLDYLFHFNQTRKQVDENKIPLPYVSHIEESFQYRLAFLADKFLTYLAQLAADGSPIEINITYELCAVIFHDSLEDAFDNLRGGPELNTEEKISYRDQLKRLIRINFGDFTANAVEFMTKFSNKSKLFKGGRVEKFLKQYYGYDSEKNEKKKELIERKIKATIERVNIFAMLVSTVIDVRNGIFLALKACDVRQNADSIGQLDVQRKAIFIGNFAILCISCGMRELGKRLLAQFLDYIYYGEGDNDILIQFKKYYDDKVKEEDEAYRKFENDIVSIGKNALCKEIDINLVSLPIWSVHQSLAKELKSGGNGHEVAHNDLGGIDIGFPLLERNFETDPRTESFKQSSFFSRLKFIVPNDYDLENVKERIIKKYGEQGYRIEDAEIEPMNQELGHIDEHHSVTDIQYNALRFIMVASDGSRFSCKVVRKEEDLLSKYGQLHPVGGQQQIPITKGGLEGLLAKVFKNCGKDGKLVRQFADIFINGTKPANDDFERDDVLFNVIQAIDLSIKETLQLTESVKKPAPAPVPAAA